MKTIAPPFASEIEKDVLSVICNRPELIYTVDEILNSECFYNADYQFLFDIVMDLHRSGLAISQSSILHKIIPSGRKDLLGVYQEMKKYFTTEKYLIQNSEVLSEYSTKRALLTKSLTILNMIESNETLDDIEREVTDANSIVITRNTNSDAITMSDAIDGLFELMNREKKEGITGLSTGIPLLDNFTGGWEFDDKIVIAARPGMGKTVVATFHSYINAMRGEPTALISLEVRPGKLAGRMMSNASGVSSSKITKGDMATNQRNIVTEQGNTARSIPLYFYDNTRSSDINDIVRTMRAWHRKYKLKIIYLDYIGLVRDRTIKNSSDKTAITDSVMGKLSELGNQLGIPLIIFSQLNRGSEDKTDRRPALVNLKSSGGLEEEATRVIFLYRQDYYDKNESEAKGDESYVFNHNMEYIFAKNREGEIGTVDLKCDVSLNRVWQPKTFEEEQRAAHTHSSNAVFANVPISF